MSLILPWWWRWAALGLALLAAAAFGAVRMHEHDRKAYDKLQVEFTAFEDRVRTIGLQAKKDAQAKEAADKLKKETADAENKDALTTLARTVGELRKSHPSSSFVPEAPRGSSSPDRITFERGEFERATRELVEGVRGIADEGSSNTVKLDTVRRWAQGK